MLNKRMSHGVQLQASYTWAKGEDDAPLTGTYVVGSGDDRLSDPSNQDRDKGVVPFNQTHTFVLSAPARAPGEGDGFWDRLAEQQPARLILQWNSGLPFNIRSNRDLNLDGVQPTTGRSASTATPAASGRSSTSTPATSASSRSARVRAELFVEAKNVFNTGCSDPAEYATCTINISAVNRVVTTNAAGNPRRRSRTRSRARPGIQQRQVQLGVKVSF